MSRDIISLLIKLWILQDNYKSDTFMQGVVVHSFTLSAWEAEPSMGIYEASLVYVRS